MLSLLEGHLPSGRVQVQAAEVPSLINASIHEMDPSHDAGSHSQELFPRAPKTARQEQARTIRHSSLLARRLANSCRRSLNQSVSAMSSQKACLLHGWVLTADPFARCKCPYVEQARSLDRDWTLSEHGPQEGVIMYMRVVSVLSK